MNLRNSDKLQRAMKSLEDAINYSRSADFQGLGIEFKSVLQAAVVQNFSLTFRVCQKMIEYQLADRFGEETVEGRSPDALIRMAAKEGIISSEANWLEYLDCEHLSQTGTIALRTFEKASAFLADADELIKTCARRGNNERRRAA